MSKNEPRAGIIPFFRNKNKELIMMFMMPSDEKYGGKTFQIAKGRIDDGENPLQAAIREGGEELGLRPENIRWIKKCGVYLGNHHIFIAEVTTDDPLSYDTPHFETGKTAWLTEDEIVAVGRELHIPIIKDCLSQFKQKLSHN